MSERNPPLCCLYTYSPCKLFPNSDTMIYYDILYILYILYMLIAVSTAASPACDVLKRVEKEGEGEHKKAQLLGKQKQQPPLDRIYRIHTYASKKTSPKTGA